MSTFLTAALATSLLSACGAGQTQPTQPAQEAPKADAAPKEPAGPQEVNVYTARHYEIDDKLFEEFKTKTGITVNVVKGKANELTERLRREGSSTPADLFVTVDGGALSNAEEFFQPLESETIAKQVPEQFRDKENNWVGISTRARVIVYSKDRVQPDQLSTYEDLATDKWKGKVLVRSSSNQYNQSLLASFIELNGAEQTEAWAKGIANNLARDPEGGDRDQIKGIVAGLGDVGISNTYYVGLMLNSKDPEEVKVAEQVGVFFPNQDTTGTHLNISGVGLIKSSKNKENAIKLVEYLTSKEAQTLSANENFEFPVNPEADLPELLKTWGSFKAQDLDYTVLATNNKQATEIMNKVGWK
ncbi:Fe(3+) ABC transporter substrate-binding protein [Ammoniphilus sp. CFH 90114]|uniref:Fe(3+) ABC transporter substrate-binding protein n=1 Tax=Ammoniphilus sp. CFH 90114 TaxID=2493665 RepID=UPI00100E2158|nr:Fe(3+) ABC transporter substrate-binding protein [Ammoniphilus sp. CFH 90114]RXT15546.1 Fe(3+) ABC transporter substrate-binding protein [Ammoniphilus sp. CFH 90114]